MGEGRIKHLHCVEANIKKYNQPLLLITGSSRSGKTILSRLLASCDWVEWLEEPISIACVVKMYMYGNLNADVFKAFFVHAVCELSNESILGRNYNFRPGDESSIWGYKTPAVIFNRINNLNSRQDVELYRDRYKPVMIIDLPDIVEVVDLIRETSTQIITINMIRNPWDVADDFKRKQWCTDAAAVSTNNFHWKGTNKKVPIWVNEEFIDLYNNSGEYERGLYAWLSQVKNSDNVTFDATIRYEDLIDDASSVLDSLFKFSVLNSIRITDITKRLLCEIKKDYGEKLVDRQKHYEIEDNELFKDYIGRYGYGK